LTAGILQFEQLKKEQAKKGKKGGSKKKADKDKDAPEDVEDAEKTADVHEDEEAEDAVSDAQPSKSFKDEASAAQSEVQDLYKKQTARIEELEKENQALKEQQEQDTTRLAKTEEELDLLREGSSELAELRSKAKETDRLTHELASVQRQLAQAQKDHKGSTRRQSSVKPDVTKQLASKEAAIQSLELDISNLRNQISALESTLAERDAAAKDLEERATAAETATSAAKQELDALKLSLAVPAAADSSSSSATEASPEALTNRITVLESDLRTATATLDAAAHRATSLEAKIEALTKLHKDATTASQAKDRELADLRSQLQRRIRARTSHVRDASEFELGDDDADDDDNETAQLHARIRALEAEAFDLRRGVWREKRAELQPGMHDEPQTLEDVDLTTPFADGRTRGSVTRQTSTFQDVIASGINAFTGRDRDPAVRDRAGSTGLLSEDGFDEEAFRLAQEEEQKRRIERIKEVKRGLDQWKGWRVDIADFRQHGIGDGRQVGPVFEL
jgi:chromosome segregation ATPase